MDRTSFTITQFIDGRLSDTAIWTGYPLDWLQSYAKEVVDETVADRVEIRDQTGDLLFHWPEG
jgi:hypothetical protein